ncbi:hypothetical protein, partial [Paenibacillus popilliae]
NAANYEQINYWAKKGERVRVDAAAKSSGKSRAAFIQEAIDEKIEREGLESPSENEEQDKKPRE